MAENSRFFNSTPTDRRRYPSADFAEFMRTFYSDGVVSGGSKLQVTKGSVLNVTVSPGMAMVQGYWYQNTASATLQVTAASTTLPRIDRVVLRLDLTLNVRAIKLAVLAGTPAASPQPPALTRNENIYELSLAQLYVPANATAISTVTDERTNAAVCGLTQGVYSVDLTQFEQQLAAKIADFQAQGAAAIAQIQDLSNAAFLAKIQAVDGPDSGIDAATTGGKTAAQLQDYKGLSNTPSIQNIYNGTVDPASTLGQNGDIYVKYSS